MGYYKVMTDWASPDPREHPDWQEPVYYRTQTLRAYIAACREANSWIQEIGVPMDSSIRFDLTIGFGKVFWNCLAGTNGEDLWMYEFV